MYKEIRDVHYTIFYRNSPITGRGQKTYRQWGPGGFHFFLEFLAALQSRQILGYRISTHMCVLESNYIC